MIATGYFAKVKSYLEADMFPVSVAGRTPAFFKYPKWTNFAPRKELFWKWKSGEISNEEYAKQYTEYLENSISQEALNKIKLLSDKKDIVMCCYEKPSDFCHRHILADWLSRKLTLLIGEVTIVKMSFPKGND